MRIKSYIAPTSLDAAIAALRDDGAIPLAGGTDIIPQTMTGREVPAVVDVKRLAELNVIEHDGDTWAIGAGVASYRLSEHDRLAGALPGLVEGAALIGSTQIQGRATLGGNVGNASPAADTVPALLANHARVEIAGPDGTRSVPVSELITGPGVTQLTNGELMVRFLITQIPGSADAALRFTPRTEMDIAVANAAARITLDDTGACTGAEVAIGGVGPTAVLVEDAGAALIGAADPDDALATVAAACRAAADPIDDKRGTVAYRQHAVGVLATRAVSVAWQRAQIRHEERR